jgi:hypothetical protein
MAPLLAVATVYCLLRGRDVCRPLLLFDDDIGTGRLSPWLYFAMAAVYVGLTLMCYGYAQQDWLRAHARLVGEDWFLYTTVLTFAPAAGEAFFEGEGGGERGRPP